MPATTTKIGQSVREQRTAANLTHEQLACLVGCDANTIGRIERGEGDPSVRVLKRLSEIFGVGIDAMISTSQPTFAEEMNRCVNIIGHLFGESIEDCLRIVARSAKNDDVATFFYDMSAWVESDDCKNAKQHYREWNDKKQELENILLCNPQAHEIVKTKKFLKEYPNYFNSYQMPFSERLDSLLDYGQKIIVVKIFSPSKMTNYSPSEFYEGMKHFVSTL